MGVVYKLNPEVKEFVIEKKKTSPHLSCRKLSPLIKEAFQIKLSKSTINSIIKESGLSLPVGRRRKIIKQPDNFALGTYLLKAADALAGGVDCFATAIKESLKSNDADILAKTEFLLYAPLFGKLENLASHSESGIWALIDKKIDRESIKSYLIDMQRLKELPSLLSKEILSVTREVRCVEISLQDKPLGYFDGQLHTIWATDKIPCAFSTNINDLNNYITRYFEDKAPFIFFMAPGYEEPPKEFFDFLLNFASTETKNYKFTYHNCKANEITSQDIKQDKKGCYIFGLWPWQYNKFRTVKDIGEFRKTHFRELKKDFYIAKSEVELFQQALNKKITLRGCALKVNSQDNTKLIILTNLPGDKFSLEYIAENYLYRWPNLEETLQDFSRKMELYTYKPETKEIIEKKISELQNNLSLDIFSVFNSYLNYLKLSNVKYFFPLGYEKEDFSVIKERFYDLRATIKQQKDVIQLTFLPENSYKYLNDLEYACFRVNERNVIFHNGKRLWCSVRKANI